MEVQIHALLGRTFRALCLLTAFMVAAHAAEATPVCVYPGATLACLDEVDQTPIGTKTPLILIHGWNQRGIPGEPHVGTWNNLVAYFNEGGNAALRSGFKLYEFRYYSNLVDVATLAGALRDVIDAHSDVSRARQVVFVTHSMGGLIARYFLGVPQSGDVFRGLPGGERTALVVTLGTPHHGSPLANGHAVSDKLDGVLRQLWERIHDLYFLRGDPGWWEVNRSDLRWDNFDQVLDYATYASEQNALLEAMNSDGRYDRKIIAYGGALGACSVVLHPISCGVNTIIAAVFGVASDGFVPLSSALSYRTSNGDSRFRTRYLPDHDHTEIAEGKGGGALFNTLKTDILAAIPTPLPTPSPGRASVSISFNPDPVPPSLFGGWQFEIRIRETAGVGVTLNRLIVNGRDVSAQIRAVFGTDHLPGGGEFKGPSSVASFADFDQVRIELGGDDDNGNRGLRWSATVRLLP